MARSAYFNEVTGQGDWDREAYLANKAALGGQTINQTNLNNAAAAGALGTDAAGNTVRNPGAMDAYLDEIMAMVAPVSVETVATIPTTRGAQPQQQATPNNRDVPLPRDRPTRAQPPQNGPTIKTVKTIPYTEQDITQLEQAVAQGVPWESILGGALGGGVVAAAKAFYDNWQKSSAGGAKPNANGGAATPNSDNPNMGGPTGPRNGPHPFAQIDNAAGGSYLEWLMNPEVSGTKETPNERLGNVVDGTFTDPTKMTAITHSNPTDMFNSMRADLLAQQSVEGTGTSTHVKNNKPSYTNNNVVQGSFDKVAQGSVEGRPHDYLSPAQIDRLVQLTVEGGTPDQILDSIQKAGIDLTDQAVANAVRQVITGAF